MFFSIEIMFEYDRDVVYRLKQKLIAFIIVIILTINYFLQKEKFIFFSYNYYKTIFTLFV